MGIYAGKLAFQALLGGAERRLVARRVHPDRLTLAALALACLGGAALWDAVWWRVWLLLVPPVALDRTALNALDGLLARRLGLACPWGKILINEVGDRLADVALFTGVALAPGADTRLGAAVLVLMVLTSYVGTAARADGDATTG